MFQIKARDGLGKIGKLEINGKTIETPTIMPVIHPDPDKQLVPMETVKKLADVVITNSYIIYSKPELREIAEKKGVHKLIGFDKVVVTDSGSFQLSVYGSIDVKPLEIVEFQEKIGVDVGTILDIPTPPYADRERAEKEMEETIRRGRESLELKRENNYKMLLNGTIQGSTYMDLRRRCAEIMGSMNFDIYPIGAVVPLLEKYDYKTLVDVILNSKMGLPTNKPVHLFGCGHPTLFAISVLLGCDLFDSAAYALYAKDDRYLTENGTYYLEDLKDLKQFPCSCPVCSEYSPREVYNMDKKEKEKVLAEHNLYVTFEEMSRVKEAIREGALWELVELRCRSHPRLLEAYRQALKYVEFIEKFDPVTKKSGFFYSGYESLFRPEVIRHKERIHRIRFEKIYITTVSKDVEKPYSENLKILPSDVDILVKDDVFGLIPLNIDLIYPLLQSEVPELYDIEKSHNKKFVKEFIERYKDRIMDIVTYNYYISYYNSKENKKKINSDIIKIDRMLQYQYGFKILDEEVIKRIIVRRSKRTGWIRNVLIVKDGEKKVLFTLRSYDNFLIPTAEGAKLLHSKIPYPKYRVVVDRSVERFAREGRSVYAKFVVDCDRDLRPYEEVLVVNEDDELLGYGTTILNGRELMEFNYGVAVDMRGGISDKEQ
ncbi:MAG TPA: tRNA guanosine(15) transglycosylase TgtA [Methanothermococcus okinawensis]|uniref:tRNA-guanine(15) transglycosylase n=1 Tax=Methanofervidicoccus abyssi TaxID=2082189 RepID=A0A401HQ35_9EURY|nr:tRNA guanosine(15) transglycosylase TgtA [Methanofervidicoccus abyssi]GBF36322.1 7-cyano-7-deazaguanine tRNA-ribosyltransferase [Methanofervidicoccus abyssi]HIP15850.1 tRNA guanosine(15) transglycosylase TgtA [Methanothermococcus okinawensis]